MLSYSVVIFIFIIALIVLAYQYIVSVSKQNAMTNQSQLMEKISSQVESYLDGMYNIGSQVAQDTRIRSTFSELQNEDNDPSNYFDSNLLDSIDIGSILTSYNLPEYQIWRISVYNQYGDYKSTVYSQLEQFNASILENQISSVMTQLQNNAKDNQNDSSNVILLTNQDNESSNCVMLLPITNYYSDEIYGIVEIQQNIDQLEKSIALDQLQDTTVVYLFDEDGNQILPLNHDFNSLDKNSYYITTDSVGDYDWQLALTLDYTSMIEPYQGMLIYVILASLVIIIILLSAIYLITKRITAPLITLNKNMRQVTLDNVSTYHPEDEDMDEVRELNLSFNAMLQRMNKSLAYEKRAYLQALQSQMDPHFLYNILTVISGIGLETGNTQLVNICDKISAIMRYNASLDDSYVTLEDEVVNATNYLELMKIRYEDYFSYVIHIDDSVKSLKMPRQLLQPILENSFEHGFKNVAPQWKIQIRAGKAYNRWYIKISDNGSGFNQKELENLYQKLEEYSKNLPENYSELKIGGMGLINTILRLKILLGDDVEFYIEPNKPRGTTIVLCEGKGVNNGQSKNINS